MVTETIKQISLIHIRFELASKRTRNGELRDVLNIVNLWAEILWLLLRHVPECRMGRTPFALEIKRHIHLRLQLFGLSDPDMEEALHDVPLYREFARLDVGMSRIPDESTILRFFRHFPEAHQLDTDLLGPQSMPNSAARHFCCAKAP